MPQLIIQIVETAQHAFIATAGQSPAPLLLVAGFAGASGILYGLTRGREFLIAGYSSVLFLVPFVRLG